MGRKFGDDWNRFSGGKAPRHHDRERRTGWEHDMRWKKNESVAMGGPFGPPAKTYGQKLDEILIPLISPTMGDVYGEMGKVKTIKSEKELGDAIASSWDSVTAAALPYHSHSHSTSTTSFGRMVYPTAPTDRTSYFKTWGDYYNTPYDPLTHDNKKVYQPEAPLKTQVLDYVERAGAVDHLAILQHFVRAGFPITEVLSGLEDLGIYLRVELDLSEPEAA